ncbi:hypothetical protein [Streptomyces sp. ISL-94]|uniref:hypothetical protein n=1 Tax=Streptomyces sp. ISL-94 TaxID=2819190 RepID=UPI001BE6C4F7|nr:hypothetical protein [Streptomyces sp. ISL-94]MBT2477614.1 hypothetical protein [Streptomyces sp. ISL-94]
MTGQLELWSEPCDTAPPEWTDDQLAEWLQSRHRPISGDHGRPPGRPDAWRLFKPVTDVQTQGDLL